METKDISETLVSENLEIGGDAYKNIFVEDVTQPLTYSVKSFEVIKTQWGDRIDFILVGSHDEWKISSWAFVCKRKFKPVDLIGKQIRLSPHSEKKLLLEF